MESKSLMVRVTMDNYKELLEIAQNLGYRGYVIEQKYFSPYYWFSSAPLGSLGVTSLATAGVLKEEEIWDYKLFTSKVLVYKRLVEMAVEQTLEDIVNVIRTEIK